MSQNPIQLDYAPPTPIVRRKWFRLLCWIALSAAAAWGAWKFVPPVWNKIAIWYWQHEAMNEAMDPSWVCYSERTIDRFPPYSAGLRPGERVERAPANTSAYYLTAHQSSAMVNLAKRWSLTVREGTIYLHGRRGAKDGPLRLVHVAPAAWLRETFGAARFASSILVVVEVIRPDEKNQPAAVMNSIAYPLMPPRPAPLGSLRLYAGQTDPKDESHFTIAYEANDSRGIIDGWLTEKDEIRMRLRGAATQATRPTGSMQFTED